MNEKDMKHGITILLALLLLLPTVVNAQRTKKVRVSAEGTAVGTDVVATKRDALYDAKLNALRNAGIDEAVQSFTTLVLGNDQNSMLQSAASEVSMLMLGCTQQRQPDASPVPDSCRGHRRGAS